MEAAVHHAERVHPRCENGCSHQSVHILQWSVDDRSAACQRRPVADDEALRRSSDVSSCRPPLPTVRVTTARASFEFIAGALSACTTWPPHSLHSLLAADSCAWRRKCSRPATSTHLAPRGQQEKDVVGSHPSKKCRPRSCPPSSWPRRCTARAASSAAFLHRTAFVPRIPTVINMFQ